MVNQFKRSVLLSVGFVAGSLLIFGIASYWLSGDLSDQADKVFGHQSVIRGHIRALATLARLKQNVSDVRAYENRINLLLPTQDDLLNFPGWLEGVSKTYHVNITFAFQGGGLAPTIDAPGSATFGIQAAGPYDNLIKFFTYLGANSDQYLLSLAGFDIAGDANSYYAATQGQVYYR